MPKSTQNYTKLLTLISEIASGNFTVVKGLVYINILGGLEKKYFKIILISAM